MAISGIEFKKNIDFFHNEGSSILYYLYIYTLIIIVFSLRVWLYQGDFLFKEF